MSPLSWIQALGLPTVFVGVLGFLIARWQLQVARKKLRHDLYERRFAIYVAFHDLLLKTCEQQDTETEFQHANAMRAHALFLLDAKLDSFLDGLLKEAFRIKEAAKLLPLTEPCGHLRKIRLQRQRNSPKTN